MCNTFVGCWLLVVGCWILSVFESFHDRLTGTALASRLLARSELRDIAGWYEACRQRWSRTVLRYEVKHRAHRQWGSENFTVVDDPLPCPSLIHSFRVLAAADMSHSQTIGPRARLHKPYSQLGAP